MIPEEIMKDVFLFKDSFGVKTSPSNIGLRKDLIEYFDILSDYLYVPKFKGKYPMNLEMICCGQHWSAVDNNYYNIREDVDGRKAPELPPSFNTYTKPFVHKTFLYHNPIWDIAIMNRYVGGTGTLGMHQDKSESKRAIESGHPVVSFSVGASCIFGLGKTRNVEKKIQLDDGDVLVFGGSARMIYHGVLKTLDNAPFRYNLTLRKL